MPLRRQPRYVSFGTRRRTKKIRSPISVKQRTAKKGGRCSACRGRFEIGDTVTVVRVKRRTYHTSTCVPADVGMGTVVVGAASVLNTSGDVAKSLSSNWSVGEAQMVGLAALENALVVKIRKMNVIPLDMEKMFDRYNKLKEVALRPGSDQEGKQAMKMATVDLVKLVFGA